MLIKVKTLTGKEIEIDIEPTDKVDIIKILLTLVFMRKLIERLKESKNEWRKRKAFPHHNSVSSSLGSR